MSKQQSDLRSFWGLKKSAPKRPLPLAVRRRRSPKSSFATCPICQESLPLHQLERHAATCNGEKPPKKKLKISENPQITNLFLRFDTIQPTSEPIPGLFLFEEFVSEEQERRILAELDGTCLTREFLPWAPSTFNGTHRGKRWGVHCNLRLRRVLPAQTPLPSFMTNLLLPKLLQLSNNHWMPNEANAIEYRKSNGDYLKAHVDDRQLSKEPIANLSLAGDCYMTFTIVKKKPSSTNVQSKIKVLLKRRTLQILTGPARYNYSHEIQNAHLLSDRRVSFTMRESPLSDVT